VILRLDSPVFDRTETEDSVMTGFSNIRLWAALGVWGMSAGLSAVLTPALAQPQDAAASVAAGVTVTDGGNRVIYSAEYFSQFNVVTASDQLERVPGLQDVLNGGGDGQRGFGSDGDQVLVNGNRVSGKANDVDSVLDRIQARQVLQIEVIRGAVPGLDVRSQGRVVNVVLVETPSSGYGSVTASADHYSQGSPGGGVEVSYNADMGAFRYLLSVEGEVDRFSSEATDRFFSPGNQLLERQIESSRDKSDELGVQANTRYTFANGNVLNLNGLYADTE